MESKSVIRHEFDRSGQYDSGLKSLVKSLQWAFGFLLVVIIGMLIYFFTAGGYFAVEPQQAVIVLKFGKFQGSFSSGGHWFMPYPVNKFVKVRTNQQSMDVDWLPMDSIMENAQPGQSLEPGRDMYLLTGDANIIHASWRLSYQIYNPAKYYEVLSTPAAPQDPDEMITDRDGFVSGRGPETLIRNLFRQAVIQVTAKLKVDEALTNHGLYTEEVNRLFGKLITDMDCGIEVKDVLLKRVFPPLRTKEAFDEVAAAGNTKKTLMDQAEEYKVQVANQMLSGKAAILAEAEAYRSNVVSKVKSESLYFNSINEQYKQSPKTVLMTLYTATLADVLQQQDGKYIIGTAEAGNGRHKQVRIKMNPEPKAQPKTDADKEAK